MWELLKKICNWIINTVQSINTFLLPVIIICLVIMVVLMAIMIIAIIKSNKEVDHIPTSQAMAEYEAYNQVAKASLEGNANEQKDEFD